MKARYRIKNKSFNDSQIRWSIMSKILTTGMKEKKNIIIREAI